MPDRSPTRDLADLFHSILLGGRPLAGCKMHDQPAVSAAAAASRGGSASTQAAARAGGAVGARFHREGAAGQERAPEGGGQVGKGT